MARSSSSFMGSLRRRMTRSSRIAPATVEKTKEEIFTEEFMDLIYNILIPYNKGIFKDIVDLTTNGHTNHLFKVGLPKPFLLQEYAYNGTVFKKEYRYVIERSKCKIIIVLVPKNFTIFMNTYEDDNKNTPSFDESTSNNISISYQPNRKMYIYGIKSLNEPRIRGNTLNKCMFDICNSMKIPNVFISDAAGVPCAWDDKITLQNFSIIRAIVGKSTFYESLTGHFVDPEKAKLEKIILEQTNDDDKAFINEYLKFNPIKNSKGCDRINEITKSALNKLDKHPEITQYVMTPYQ